MDRVFVDANVLFSAAYRENAGSLRLWKLEDVEVTTSAYAAEEARRNLDAPDARSRLESLLARTRLVPEGSSEEPLPRDIQLAAKDEPILRSAIAANATHLLTGDVRDFGGLFGRRVHGVLIQTPSQYFARRRAK